MKNKTVLRVNRLNFIIYLSCLLFGIILISIAIVLYHTCQNLLLDEILLGIGASTVPTVLTAYLIDYSSEERQRKRIIELRDHILCGMPYGLLWIMRVIVEEYSSSDIVSGKSLKECFNIAIENMENFYFVNDYDAIDQKAKREKLFERLKYGFDLCLRDCGSIVLHEYDFEINGIFIREEIQSIKFLFEECECIPQMTVISEIGERIRVAVDNVCGDIKEVSEMVNRKVTIKKNRISNWIEIIKKVDIRKTV